MEVTHIQVLLFALSAPLRSNFRELPGIIGLLQMMLPVTYGSPGGIFSLNTYNLIRITYYHLSVILAVDLIQETERELLSLIPVVDLIQETERELLSYNNINTSKRSTFFKHSI